MDKYFIIYDVQKKDISGIAEILAFYIVSGIKQDKNINCETK